MAILPAAISAPAVRVRGDGLAAAGVAHLLGRAGLAVARDAATRRRVPRLMLSEPALALLRDVFDAPALMVDAPRIVARTVAWGGETRELPHDARAVAEEVLLAEVAAMSSPSPGCEPRSRSDVGSLGVRPNDDAGDVRSRFVVDTCPPEPSGVLRFGDRLAAAVPVRVRAAGGVGTCLVEALAEGWLFMLPDGIGGGTLMAVGGAPDALLAESRLVAPAIEADLAAPVRFDATPRLATSLAEEGRLACGSGAVGFDPICGDGAAQAAREAILAAAVIVGIAEGGDARALLAHYRNMLVAAMRRHLALSADFYAAGGTGPWWREQVAALAEGHRWCTAQLATVPEPMYRLDGFRLVPRALAA